MLALRGRLTAAEGAEVIVAIEARIAEPAGRPSVAAQPEVPVAGDVRLDEPIAGDAGDAGDAEVTEPVGATC